MRIRSRSTDRETRSLYHEGLGLLWRPDPPSKDYPDHLGFGEPVLPAHPDRDRPGAGYTVCPATVAGLTCIRPAGHGEIHLCPQGPLSAPLAWVEVPALPGTTVRAQIIEDALITSLISGLNDHGLLI